MNTAQTVIGSGNKTDRINSAVPWIIGGVVVLFALWVISKF